MGAASAPTTIHRRREALVLVMGASDPKRPHRPSAIQSCWSLAMKYLYAIKELNAGEIFSIAVLIAVAAGVVYGVLS